MNKQLEELSALTYKLCSLFEEFVTEISKENQQPTPDPKKPTNYIS